MGSLAVRVGKWCGRGGGGSEPGRLRRARLNEMEGEGRSRCLGSPPGFARDSVEDLGSKRWVWTSLGRRPGRAPGESLGARIVSQQTFLSCLVF